MGPSDFPEYLQQSEGRTLEFKESCNSIQGILKSIIAFANTAGGRVVIGIRDKTRDLIGVVNALAEEERLASAISDSIEPLLLPGIDIQTVRGKELLIISVPHTPGPVFLKGKGEERGVFVRLGSTNRVADNELLVNLRLISKNRTFDETLFPDGKIDEDLLQRTFAVVGKKCSTHSLETLGIYSQHQGNRYATIGGTLLFNLDRLKWFPDSMVRCARFLGVSREKILDQVDIEFPLIQSIEQAIHFIERNTRKEGRIGTIYREDISEYPLEAVREALINAIVHTDYSIKGSHIQIAIFDDRIEFTSPGGLPFGQTMEKALSGFSRLRNRVLGRVFKELKLIEQWGSGLQRIRALCQERGLKTPEIADCDGHFRVTLYSTIVANILLKSWEQELLDALQKDSTLSTQQAAQIWGVSDRSARTRLQQMLSNGLLYRIATSPQDPQAVYMMAERYR